MEIERRLFEEPQWCHIELTDGRACFGLVSEEQVGETMFLRVDYCTEPGSECEVSRLVNVDLVAALVLADSVRDLSPPDVPEPRKPKKSRTGFPRTRKTDRDATNLLGNLIIGDFGYVDLSKVPF